MRFGRQASCGTGSARAAVVQRCKRGGIDANRSPFGSSPAPCAGEGDHGVSHGGGGGLAPWFRQRARLPLRPKELLHPRAPYVRPLHRAPRGPPPPSVPHGGGSGGAAQVPPLRQRGRGTMRSMVEGAVSRRGFVERRDSCFASARGQIVVPYVRPLHRAPRGPPPPCVPHGGGSRVHSAGCAFSPPLSASRASWPRRNRRSRRSR